MSQSASLTNSLEYETQARVKPSGFREYDARWLFGEELNLLGAQAIGFGLGELMFELGVAPDIIVAHDYRSYSASIKFALATGLVAAGIRVHDVGLAITPMAYFAQGALDIASVAMVTASHNENGWTGIKMSVNGPLTFGPAEMGRLKEIVLSGRAATRSGGGYAPIPGIRDRYISDLTSRPRLRRPVRVVVACGNGTASVFAPQVLELVGAEVIPLDTHLDHTFPRYNPNPESLEMLSAMRQEVLRTKADVALGFDGDGDRCGVVDDEGEEIFSDKVGLLLARNISSYIPDCSFVVDVKSTGLFASDPVLAERGVRTEYWKTGHSYMKRRIAETSATAGFEKSGHFFFNPPLGRGYDDGLITALAVLDLLDSDPRRSMSDLKRELPRTWSSPTLSPFCPDEAKYGVVAAVTAAIEACQASGEGLAGFGITDIVTTNGIRVLTSDGTWGLIRASSNKPELVVVVESPVSEARMLEMLEAIDAVLRREPQVGPYGTTIDEWRLSSGHVGQA